MIEELEKIVIEKSYLELTLEEKSDLQEWISSEEEFNQMKMMFSGLSMQKSNMEEVKPSTNLKNRLLAEFENTYSHKRLAWYNRLGLFLWPAEKPWHRKPAFQMVAVACLLVLVITVAPNISPENTQMAKQEVSEKENDLIREKIVEESNDNKEYIRQQNNSDTKNQLNVSTDQKENQFQSTEDELVFKDADLNRDLDSRLAEPFMNRDKEELEASPIMSPLKREENSTLAEDSKVDALKDQPNKSEITTDFTFAPAAPVATTISDKNASSGSRAHPDGIYVAESADDSEMLTTNTKSVGQQSGILDLLTAAY